MLRLAIIFDLLKSFCMSAAILAALSCCSRHTSSETGNIDNEGFIKIFDGKSLNNWVGDSTYWRIEDSCLTGIVTPATLLKEFVSGIAA
jgi:hypothetical protein